MENTEVKTAQPVSSEVNTILAQNENVLILVQFKNKNLGKIMYDSMDVNTAISPNGELFVNPDVLLGAFATASSHVIATE